MEMMFHHIKKHLRTIDWFLVICVCVAFAFGFIAIRSATNFFPRLNPPRSQTRLLMVQAAAIAIGIVGMFILSKMDYMHVLKYCKYLYIFSVVLLVAVLFFGVGDEVGNRSWFRFGPVGFQPSEFVKLAFIVVIANHLDKNRDKINHPKNILQLFLYFGILFGLILAAGDLGNNLIYGFIFLAMCFAAGMSLWYFLGGAFVLAALSPILWRLLAGYRQDRIQIIFDPTMDPEGVGYQVLMSMRAIGSGGLLGHGYQQGPITQRTVAGRFIPEQWTDFIFAGIGEEFGFIGAILALLILVLIVVRILIISRNARSNVGSLICVGVMSMIIAQSVVNIGMTLGLVPVIGVTLPFFSYGGSSVISSLWGIGMVLSVRSRTSIYYFTRDEIG